MVCGHPIWCLYRPLNPRAIMVDFMGVRWPVKRPWFIHIIVQRESVVRLNRESSVKKTAIHWFILQYLCSLHHTKWVQMFTEVNWTLISGLVNNLFSWSLLQTMTLENRVPVAAYKSRESWKAAAPLLRLMIMYKWRSSQDTVALGRLFPGSL